jgi:hypothetical protein
MSKPRCLTLIVPQLSATDHTEHAPADTAWLAALMTRGTVAPLAAGPLFAALAPWQRLLHAVLCGDAPSEHPASAPVSWLGEGGSADAPYLLHATPVVLVATTDRLRLGLLPAAELGETQGLADTLAAQWCHEDATFEVLQPGSWYLRVPRSIEASTVPLPVAASHDVRETLPVGRDAAWLRRVTTEAQMLLHEHPCNADRERRGLLPVSSVWLWGGGEIAMALCRRSTRLESYGTEAYLRGLMRLAGAEAPRGLEAARTTLQARGGDTLIVTDAESLAQFEHDWLAPATAALRAGTVDRLMLALGSHRIEITRGMLRRFWRRPRPLDTWFA